MRRPLVAAAALVASLVATLAIRRLRRWFRSIPAGARWARAAARRRRLREIGRALARHGLGWVVGPRGLGFLLPFHRGLLGHIRRPAPYTRPEHVRLALEELGPTFVKLGQILSTRADLLPPPYLAQLALLQDQAPREAWPAMESVLRAELGVTGLSAFAHIDPTPVAAASIGQAHAAVLRDGTEVIVKIRRPGVVERVAEDLELVEEVAGLVHRRVVPAGRFDVVGLAHQFAETLRAELDYVAEATNAERVAANFAGDPAVRIPRVYRELSTARVLTLERLRGLKVTDLAGLDAAGVDRRALARRAATILLQMVYRDGFFHADPHAGNFLVAADGTIGLIDFGMVGTVDARTRQALLRELVAIVAHDSDGLVDAFLTLGLAGAGVDRARLGDDLGDLFRVQLDRPLGEIAVGTLLRQALEVMRRHHLALPANLALLVKTIAMTEGIGAQLDPTFNLMTMFGDPAAFVAIGAAPPPAG